MLEQWPALLRGAGFTLALSAVSAVVGVSLGIACGWVRANGPRWLSAMAAGSIEQIRNTPFIVQLFRAPTPSSPPSTWRCRSRCGHFLNWLGPRYLFGRLPNAAAGR